MRESCYSSAVSQIESLKSMPSTWLSLDFCQRYLLSFTIMRTCNSYKSMQRCYLLILNLHAYVFSELVRAYHPLMYIMTLSDIGKESKRLPFIFSQNNVVPIINRHGTLPNLQDYQKTKQHVVNKFSFEKKPEEEEIEIEIPNQNQTKTRFLFFKTKKTSRTVEASPWRTLSFAEANAKVQISLTPDIRSL